MVAEVELEVILGVRFLWENKVLVDAANERCLWPEQDAEAQGFCRVVSARPTVVTGGMGGVVQGCVVQDWPEGHNGVLVSILEVGSRHTILVRRGLV